MHVYDQEHLLGLNNIKQHWVGHPVPMLVRLGRSECSNPELVEMLHRQRVARCPTLA
jgi:hypothetical protein